MSNDGKGVVLKNASLASLKRSRSQAWDNGDSTGGGATASLLREAGDAVTVAGDATPSETINAAMIVGDTTPLSGDGDQDL